MVTKNAAPILHVQQTVSQRKMLKMNLHERINRFLDNPRDLEELEILLLSCIEIGGMEGLGCANQMLTAMLYDDHLPEVKWSTWQTIAICFVHWGSDGLALLTDFALNYPRLASIRVVTTLLAYASTGSTELILHADSRPKLYFPRLIRILDLSAQRYNESGFIASAKHELLRIVTNLDKSELFSLTHVLNMISIHAHEPKHAEVIENLLGALNSRWFGLNKTKLEEYRTLISSATISEEAVHVFLAENPYILNPFYARIWSKERLGERLIADFMVRQMDDDYVIVEIEKPTDQIITKNGNLTTKTTHAVRQALEYREWLLSNLLYSKQRFENIWRPSCLVVIGMESTLNHDQLRRLQQENESRQGIVRIVGFDWLYHRSEAILDNVINHGLTRYVLDGRS